MDLADSEHQEKLRSCRSLGVHYESNDALNFALALARELEQAIRDHIKTVNDDPRPHILASIKALLPRNP
jgi:hypothetical protein